MAFATPADLFVSAERAKYMGLFGSVFGLASIIGPFLGGLLTDQISWHWVFYVNIPVGLVALAFVMTKMPHLASGQRAKIDWLGTVLLIGAVVPLMLGLSLDKSIHPWSSPLIIALFTAALVCTTLFLIVELRVASPVISLALFRNRTFVVGVGASMLSGAALFGAILFLSLFLVNVLGFTATQAGITQIPLMAGFVLGSNGSSLLVERMGRYKPLIVAGFIIMTLGFFLMSQMSITSSGYDVAWRVFLVGLGIGPALPLLNLAMQNAVPAHQIGAATANRQFFQQLGQAIGGAIFGVVLTTSLTIQLQQNFAPITQGLPATVQAVLDPAQFRNSVSAEEGGGSQIHLDSQVTTAMVAPIQQQRRLAQAALGAGDANARTQLLNDPETLPEIKAQVQHSAGADPQGLVRANQAIAAAEQQVEQTAHTISQRLNGAVRVSYAVSITQIYLYAFWLAILALVIITLWLPEIPLSRHSHAETPPVVE
jgi:MFS family permease